MNNKVEYAAEVMSIIYDTFEKDMLLPAPFFYNEVFHRCDRTHYQDMYHPYWYHPDHLGSSSYITNLDGEINQHLEYLPFGEALVEEHLSSYNSPFKFNAKELDAETGNYYYGARYYDPKLSIWLSVDPLAEKYPDWSPYNYTLQNPINMVDPDGRDPWKPIVNDDGSTSYVKEEGDTESTLQSQYGLDKKTAENLYSTIDENGVISGEEVYNETGKDILQLDVTSSQATEQRMIDQISFAILSSGRGGKKYNYNFSVWDYFKNTTKGFQTRDLTGNWTFRDGSTGRVRIESFPMYRTQGIINIKAYPWYIGNYLYGNPRD